jgi:hypothetical protein
MKTLAPGSVAFVLTVTAGLWFGAGAEAAKAGTAKKRLAEARAAALKWQPDAELVTLSSLKANDDGTAPAGIAGWVYTFYSKKTGKWIAYDFGPKGIEATDLPSGLKAPVPGDFIDSDKVLPEVSKHGFKKSGDTLLQLNVVYDKNVKAGIYWCATGMADLTPQMGPRSWCVDPKSGKFVARLSGGDAAVPATKPTAPKAGGTFTVDLSKCGGFTAADAAGLLGAPAAQVKMVSAKAGDNEWKCTFSAAGKSLAFTISSAASVKEAEARVEKYRKTLGDNYTELMLNNNAEGIWSNAGATLTVRRGNVIVRTLPPLAKVPQAKLANDVVGKF